MEIKDIIKKIRKIRKKKLRPGYIWVPYIIEEKSTIISEGSFSPNKVLSSRYASIKIEK